MRVNIAKNEQHVFTLNLGSVNTKITVDTFGKKAFILRMKFVAHERFQYVLLKKFGENIDVLLIVQIVLERFAIVVGLYFCRG